MYARPSKILIIDDDVELVTLLVDYFTLEGFEATPALRVPKVCKPSRTKSLTSSFSTS